MAGVRSYGDDVAEAILRRLGEGEPLAVICREDGMPDINTVSDWKRVRPGFQEAFNDARDQGFDAIAAGCRETARGRGDSMEDVQRDKLIIETDLKLLAKWDPRRYGDRMTLAGDKENPVSGLTGEQIDARLRELGVDPSRLGGTKDA